MRTRQRHPAYDDYVLENETVKFALHRHWAILVRPVGLFVGPFFAAFVVVATMGRATGELLATGLLIWSLVQLVYLLWQIVEWRSEFFVATDKRLLLVQGLLFKSVGTMPMAKVTDLSYQRSIIGRLVGYGRFIFESAGQDQALRQIDWIPYPDHYYRLVDSIMHGLPPDERDRPFLLVDAPRVPAREQPAPEALGPGPEASPGSAPGSNTGSAQSPVSPVSPIHEPAVEVIYESEDIRARRRSDDTRAIPLVDYPDS